MSLKGFINLSSFRTAQQAALTVQLSKNDDKAGVINVDLLSDCTCSILLSWFRQSS